MTGDRSRPVSFSGREEGYLKKSAFAEEREKGKREVLLRRKGTEAAILRNVPCFTSISFLTRFIRFFICLSFLSLSLFSPSLSLTLVASLLFSSAHPPPPTHRVFRPALCYCCSVFGEVRDGPFCGGSDDVHWMRLMVISRRLPSAPFA